MEASTVTNNRHYKLADQLAVVGVSYDHDIYCTALLIPPKISGGPMQRLQAKQDVR
jgi:hypothetical protein